MCACVCSGGQLSQAALQQVRQEVRGSAVIRDQLQELCRAHLHGNHHQCLCCGEKQMLGREELGSDATNVFLAPTFESSQ